MVEYTMKKDICGIFHAKCGIWRKFSGLSRERRDGWSPHTESIIYPPMTQCNHIQLLLPFPSITRNIIIYLLVIKGLLTTCPVSIPVHFQIIVLQENTSKMESELYGNLSLSENLSSPENTDRKVM
jgi:hypothetical protein